MGVRKWECLSGKRYGSACACKRVCAGVRCVCIAALRRSLRPTAHTASSACASLKQRCDPPDPDLHTHIHREAQRGAARTTKDCHEPMKTHRECIQGQGGGSGRPGQCHCHAGSVPCPTPDGRMADPLLGLACTHAAWHWPGMAWQWPLLGLACTHAAWHWPGSGMPSRSVASSALHALTMGFISSCHSLVFSIFFLWFCSM